ncbi:MAG: CBS domain-containing protein [Elusimicrobiota bacterium]|nr:MAG: CBS domain-containing protein [Elusimicrobiota bacterium]
MDLKCVDDVIVTPDKDCFQMTRKLATMEGILTGGSGGSAVFAGLQYAKKLTEKDYMVILVPDTGMRYLSKIYNDEWMKENQYFESEVHLKVADILSAKRKHKARGNGKLATAKPTDTLFGAMGVMRKNDISQLPVFEKNRVVGTVMEDAVLGMMLKGRDIKKMIVREAMTQPLPVMTPEARVESVLRYFTPTAPPSSSRRASPRSTS